MKQIITQITFLIFFINIAHAQYSETFDVPNKGILAGTCTTNNPTTCASNDFAGVNWTIEGNLSGFAISDDYFKTINGKLEAKDVDEEACWLSPVLNMTGTVSFSLDLTWLQYDDYDISAVGSKDYIDVSYRIDGGSWVTLANAVGGGPRTISYLGQGGNIDGSISGLGASGLTGSTLQIRVCVDVNSAQEITTIDNVTAVNATTGTVGPVCDLVLNTTDKTDEDCPGANDGTITVNATTSNGPITYTLSGPVNASNQTGIFTNLPPGNYSVALQDGSFTPGTCTANTGTINIAPGVDNTDPSGQVLPIIVDCPDDIPDPDITEVTNVDDNCMIPCVTEPWINEFHYDNIGTDVNEFIEVAGPAGIDLSSYDLYTYDGFDGQVDQTFTLSGVIPDQDNGFGGISFATPNLQNTTEGIVLVKNGTSVIEFISYEGVVTATDGPANGMTSVDVGVAESNDVTPANGSLGRIGSGNKPGDFTWAVLTQTQGTLNTGQTISDCPDNEPVVTFVEDVITSPGAGSAGDPYVVTRIYRITDAAGNTTDINQTITANNCCPTYTNNIVYVNLNATGDNNGTSWADAFTDLQSALNSTCPGISEIWVAAGTYYPTSTTNRDISFVMKNGVAIYGGFEGTEAQLSERDWVNNETILSGDIGTVGNSNDNSYTVVIGSGTNSTAVIDGFTITGGNANVTTGTWTTPNRTGGGMYNSSGSPTISNCRFSGNSAYLYGGGMYNSSSSPIISNCIFSGNNTGFGSNGGGMYNNNSSPTIINTVFLNNTTDYFGGGIYNSSSSPTITNCTFSGNGAEFGGGMSNHSSSSPLITNSTFSGNTGVFGGSGMYNNSSSPTITNCIIWGNINDEIQNVNSSSPTVSYSIVKGGYTGTNNLDTDPLFVNAGGRNYRLTILSPAINTGDPATNLALFPGGPDNPEDLEGNQRIVGTHIDMGAYEARMICPPGNVLYVAANATGINNGTSWTDAFTDLQDALNSVCPGISEIWVAAGTYYPTSGTDRNISFVMKNGVEIYGGFNGTETQLSERDWATNETILSGDIGTPGDNSDNSYTVVNGTDTDATAVIDGFTIKLGYAPFTAINDPSGCGGGMFIGNNSSPVIANCKLTDNFASNGGAIFSYAASDPTATTPEFINCTFANNAGGNYGGAIYNNNCNPTISGCTFTGNYASAFGYGGGAILNVGASPEIENSDFIGNNSGFAQGGAIANWEGSNPSISNCRFENNAALVYGGGIYISDNSSATITNCLFTGSTSNNQGSAVTIDNNSSANIINSTFTGNTSNTGGGAVFVRSGCSATILNTIFWENQDAEISTESGSTITVSYSIVKQASGVYPGTGNKNEDPLFADPSNGDLRLQPCSPAINAGDNAAVPAGITSDLDGNPRFYNSGTVDMGAYEYQGNAVSGPVVYVNDDASGNNEGTSWADAFNDLQDALALASTCTNVTEIWVAAGTYYPTSGTDRGIPFFMVNGVAIYGGFNGTETQLSERDWVANETILSGDIGTPGDNSDNSLRVVYAVPGLNSNTRLDGFTVTSANCDNENDYGGGIYIAESSPTIANCIFTNNTGIYVAGGVIVFRGSPLITNCIFTNNTSDYIGAGIANTFGSTSTAINCTFYGNSSVFGGAVYNHESPSSIFKNCIIWGNSGGIGSNSNTSYSIVQGGYTGTNNLDEDPLFMDAANGDLRLQPCSPAINAGDNTAVPPSITTDLDGNPRFYNGGTVDMGAYEYQAEKPTNPTDGGEIAASQTICINEIPAAFTNENLPSGYVGNLEYQWQKSTTSATTGFADISGADAPTFTETAVLNQTTWYRRLAKVSCEPVWDNAANSNVIEVTVEPTPVSGTLAKTPDLANVCEGDDVSATLTAGSGGNGADELEFRTHDGTNWSGWANYNSGNDISTTGLAEVEIRTRRTADYCSNADYSTVNWQVEPNPVSGTLAKTPDLSNVCEGADVSAALTAGSGGNGADELEFRTHDGTNWSGWVNYVSGNDISTTGKTEVEIRTRRTANFCDPGDYQTVSWTVEQTPVSGALTKTPDVATVCESDDVSAALTAGSGGNGADELEFRTHDGTTWTSWANYISGNGISTTGLTEVEIRTRRTATYCDHGDYQTVSWTVDPTTVAGSISGDDEITYGSSTGDLTLAGYTGDVVKWQKRPGTSGTWTDIAHTTGVYSEAPAMAGTWQYRAVVQSGTCSQATTDPHSVVVNPKELTIGGSFTALDKIYDDNTDATFDDNSLVLTGVVGTDDVSLTGLEIDFESKAVGNHTVSITAALLAGADADNYTLSLDGAPETTADINPGAPVKFFVTETDGSDITSPKLQNIPFDVKVTLVDAFDNPTPNTGSDATITLTGSGGAVAGNLSFLGSVGDPVELTLATGESSFEFTDILYSGLSTEAGFDVMISATATGGTAGGNTGQSALFSVRGIFLTATADDATLPADGTSETLITVLLTDAQQPPQPLSGQQITLSTDFGTLFDISDPGNPVAIIGSQVFDTDADGEVKVSLQAAATSGVATVLALCPGACPAEAEVAFQLSAPVITGFTPGEEAVEVDFDSPANEGTDVITNYEYSLDDGANWAAFAPEQASSPVTISGLTGGESYQLQLRAINQAGTGEASAGFEVYPCYNPTNAGEIGESQTIERNTVPDELTSLQAATGHFGTLEYKWQQSTTSETAGFSDIAGTDNAAYQPGAITENTWFRRLARAACQADWSDAVASNVVFIRVNYIQDVALSAGWSYISSYVDPLDSNIENMWAEVVGENNLSILTGVNGIYAPAPFYINTLQNWDYTKGYKVKMHQADELTVIGDTLTDKSVTFGAGTHIIPVLTDHDVVLADVIENPQDKVRYMLDLSGNKVFWPEGNIYTLTDLEPGKGYLANFSQQTTIEYPDMTFGDFKSKPVANPAPGPWPIVRTANVHLISVSAHAISQLQNMDYIGAFDSYGNCVGYAEISGSTENILLTVYGDDMLTEEKDGLDEGKIISLRVFDSFTNEVTPLEAEWNQAFTHADGLFAMEGLSQIVSLKTSADANSENGLDAEVQVYPNPAKDALTITLAGFKNLSDFTATLLTADGRPVKTFQRTGEKTTVDISGLQAGVFLLRIETNENVVVKRIVVQ